jgi:hypothetical protein
LALPRREIDPEEPRLNPGLFRQASGITRP